MPSHPTNSLPSLFLLLAQPSGNNTEGDHGVGDGVSPMREPENNIPASPEGRSHLTISGESLAAGYDSDGEVGPFFDALKEEGPQELDEAQMPEAGAAESCGDEELKEKEEATGRENLIVNLDANEIRQMKVKELKEKLQERGQPTNGKKDVLVARLIDSLHLPVMSKADRDARSKDDLTGFAPSARWIMLEPNQQAIPEPQNKHGRFRPPTVPEEDADFVPQKFNYERKFDRLPFGGLDEHVLKHRNGRVKYTAEGKPMKETTIRSEGHPNAKFLEANGLSVNAHPADWYKAFLPIYDGTCSQSQAFKSCFTHQWAQYTNNRALLVGAGTQGSMYPTFEAFSHRDIEKHLAIYIMQGLNPSPQVEMKIASQMDDPCQGNDLIYQTFGGEGGKLKHKHFKAFFCVQDPKKATPSKVTRPNHKVDSLFRHMQEVSMRAWDLGPDISIDEQTIGFQGKHSDKRRITYKREGDGFQCDAICDKGFTYTFYFRNQPAPKKYLNQGLSPLHSRIMAMFDQLKDKHHNAWFDNLYLSAKFAKASLTHPMHVRISGPTRKSGRGLPACVIQEERKNPKEIREARGTVKAAVLEGDTNCPELVAVSFYDQKPVHFLSTICETIQWRVKERAVYNVDTDKVEMMRFLRLDINDDYNHKMCNVDIADQLRNYYRFDHWMRKRKWWWSMYFWGIGVLLVNTYISYRELCKQEGVKPISHYDFRKEIALAWLNPEKYWPTRYKNRKKPPLQPSYGAKRALPMKRKADDASVMSTRSDGSSHSVKRSKKITINSLDPRVGELRNRLSFGPGMHFPDPCQVKYPQCGLHNLCFKGKDNEKYTKSVYYCRNCNVHLCMICWRSFHTIQEVDSLVAAIKSLAHSSATKGGFVKGAKNITGI